MDIKNIVKEAFAELKLSPGDASKITELETKLRTVEESLATVTTERDALKTQVETLSTEAGKLAPEIVAALATAGIDSSEKLAAKLADADAFAAQQADKRTEAKTRLAALYTGDELEAEEKLLAVLSDGPVLDRQLARINADYDKKFGTNPKAPAARVSAPSPAAKVALPAADAPKLTVTEEQKKLATEDTRRSF